MTLTYSERIQEIKDERPWCTYDVDGKHLWNIYASERYRQCHDCEYIEEHVMGD